MKKKLNIVFFGDSIVSCSHLKLNKRWTQILKRKLNKKYNNLINFKTFSLDGATTNEAVDNIKSIFKIKKIDVLIFMFGINDSVYWMSKMGKPRVNLSRFRNNVNQLIKKANNHYNTQIVFIIAHKFLQNRLEGNGKTHNYNYKNYKNEILKISKSYKTKIIDIHKKLKSCPAKKYCLPLPDGLHLNDFGSLKYSKIIYKFISNQMKRKLE